MEWKIIDSLASPGTGTFFAAVSSPRNLKLILWYRSDFFLRSGHSISTSNIGFAINGRLRKIKILHAFPFSTELWTNFINTTNCPGNSPNFKGPCLNSASCRFKECPYGIKKHVNLN
ncbi:anti-adapter protein iraM [Pseudescherichia vulneris]|uniref:anti-adapter protein iraM n=1 Tax=Pseudescherichia vulneris TaxID=566 RepID=UPI00227A441D|nr:anti-adapter protein iraM [Pseudescherichia vulneris]WAH52837.1 anti-adapter protein iraM [Pseudescherichia vulneris]